MNITHLNYLFRIQVPKFYAVLFLYRVSFFEAFASLVPLEFRSFSAFCLLPTAVEKTKGRCMKSNYEITHGAIARHSKNGSEMEGRPSCFVVESSCIRSPHVGCCFFFSFLASSQEHRATHASAMLTSSRPGHCSFSVDFFFAVTDAVYVFRTQKS